MSIQDFLKEFEEILMVNPGSISEEDNLSDIEEWDSLSKVALEVFIEDNFSIQLDANMLNQFVTVKDIIDLVREKLE